MIERRFILRSDQIRAGLISFLTRLNITTLVEVIVRDYVERRTLEQNARLWALHSKAAEHTGHSAEEMHEFALMRYFGTQEIRVGDLVRHVPLKRSSQRDKKEFRAFMDSTEAWYISEFGVYLDDREAA